MRAFMKPKIGVTIGYCDLGVFGQHLSNCLFCPDKVVVAGNRLHGSVPSVWCSQMGLVGVQDIGCTLEAPPCCDDCLEYCHLGHSKKGGWLFGNMASYKWLLGIRAYYRHVSQMSLSYPIQSNPNPFSWRESEICGTNQVEGVAPILAKWELINSTTLLF